MSEPIVIVDTSEIRPGKLEELESEMAELARFAEDNEERTIAYEVFFDEEGKWVTVLQIHPDVESAVAHMELAGPRFARFKDLVALIGIDVFGSPNDELLARLDRKARLLGCEAVSVHRLRSGFARFAAVPAEALV